MNAHDLAAFDADAESFARHCAEMTALANGTADRIDDFRDQINSRLQRASELFREGARENEAAARLLLECLSANRPSGSIVAPPGTSKFMDGDPEKAKPPTDQQQSDDGAQNDEAGGQQAAAGAPDRIAA